MQFLKSRMFFITLLMSVVLTYLILHHDYGESFISIGWGKSWSYQIQNSPLFFEYITFLIFSLGYGVISYFKLKTNKILSLLHVFIMTLSIFFIFPAFSPITGLSIFLFSANIFLSIVTRNREKNRL